MNEKTQEVKHCLSAIRRLKEAVAGISTAATFMLVSGTEALAGGSGLQIETDLTPWHTFITSTVVWWAATAAIAFGAIVLMFSGFGQGGSRLVSSIAGASIALGAVTWVLASLGGGQAALMNAALVFGI